MRPTAPHEPAHAPQYCTTPLRVRYCECDPMGVAHHAAYVPWLEIGRTELLRAAGVSYAQLEQGGVFMVVVKLEVRYRKPVRYDDAVEIRTRVSAGGRVKIEHEYEVVVTEQSAHGPAHERRAGVVCATASTTLACVDAQGIVRELPAWLAVKPAPPAPPFSTTMTPR